MGSVYERGNVLWISWYEHGKKVRRSTGLPVGQEERARRLVERIERQRDATAEHVAATGGAPTVQSYGERWLAGRPAQGVTGVRDEIQQARDYIFPQLGAMKLSDVRVRHVREWIRWLRGQKNRKGAPLAPRSVHTIYGLLHRMMRDAVAEELVSESPCKPMKGDLPRKVDADPLFRHGA
ncbi:MAG: hypothetical protein ACK4N5_05320, partial [Myxococcales bacterium]